MLQEPTSQCTVRIPHFPWTITILSEVWNTLKGEFHTLQEINPRSPSRNQGSAHLQLTINKPAANHICTVLRNVCLGQGYPQQWLHEIFAEGIFTNAQNVSKLSQAMHAESLTAQSHARNQVFALRELARYKPSANQICRVLRKVHLGQGKPSAMAA